MKNTPKPFADFDQEKSVKLLELAESICSNKFDAAEHIAACLITVCPNLDIAETVLNCVDTEMGRFIRESN
jgi:hypothetical protein